MHLLRVQIPEFRVLKDVDITFEKEFFPRIFPLGSQNGGGKSTLLQLIFILLRSLGDPNSLPYLKNMLRDFKISKPLQTIAEFDIWDNNKIYHIEFCVYDNSYLIDILNKEKEISFPVFTDLEEIKKEIYTLEQNISAIESIYLEYTTNEQNSIVQADVILKVLKKLEISGIFRTFIEKSKRLQNYWVKMMLSRSIYDNDTEDAEIVGDFKILFEGLQKIVQEEKKELQTLKEHYKEKLDITKTILNHLEAENLSYITTFSSKDDENKENVLVYSIDNINDDLESFFKTLSHKVFLIAPSTQVYLFFPQNITEFLLKKQNDYNYYKFFNKAKNDMSGFFTYDFIAIDSLIKLFKNAKEKDFEKARKTGEYGNNYITLLRDLNQFLTLYKVNIDSELSGLTFEMDGEDGKTIQLYPSDLSHGELRRLSIYALLKAENMEDSIVLFDEIEIALHPDWQYRITSDLEEWGPNNQYILATHSYELCNALTPAHVKALEPKLIKFTESEI